MNSIFSLLIIFSASLSTFAQNETSKVSPIKAEHLILIINDTIIGSMGLLNKISPDKISELYIFEEEKLSATTLFIENQRKAGLITANISYDFKLKSLKELNMFFGLNAENDIYVNGYLVENKQQKIVSESIRAIKIIEARDFRLKQRVLNVELK